MKYWGVVVVDIMCVLFVARKMGNVYLYYINEDWGESWRLTA